jgi:hypothetical protein
MIANKPQISNSPTKAELGADSDLWQRIASRLWQTRPEGTEGVEVLGYKQYVGGLWDEVGKLQFEFMKTQGLRPHHVLVDIACGSLRGGRFFIPYLEPGHYLGVEKEPALIEAGRRNELAEEVWFARKPEILISADFEFEKLLRRPHFALAQSLFSHLEVVDIKRCLQKLYVVAEPGCRFYATFFESRLPQIHLKKSHSHRNFKYSRLQMQRFGESQGWQAHYIGDWNHPRAQKMMLYIKPTSLAGCGKTSISHSPSVY